MNTEGMGTRGGRVRGGRREAAETTWSHPLNPEAGMTPMPSDPREVEAALRAGKISLRLTPYYGFRYGERGVRFTQSDSAFLATLPEHNEATIKRQVEWLAGVLSNRGMPSLLLEQHLRVLARELTRAVPEKRDFYRALFVASDGLRSRRTKHMPESAGRPIGEAFPAAAGLPNTWLARGTGHLFVAAVADERAGMPNAVPSIEAFFLDAATFPPRFLEAARQTIKRARAA
ncbi:hypothetical protein [Polyangium jinanense]|uniref:Uncharacterized protein n=1 Tax=Polyangium jinanense TaxID=2829994 RepID=A0A9X3XFK6_9BACT|nr:hypothetical protein [Polyangium jinanense]MDC3961869.1 hypothetical protein [Polyangium jinanense]MDC3987813.1 hypothetical protein [Polyangium jinanense]